MKTLFQRVCFVLGVLVFFHAGGRLGAVPAEFSPQPLAQETPEGFRVPQPGHRFEFPRDHGAHPQFKVEWWYLTGHLFGPAKERFGFQATFFRRSIAPHPPETAAGESAFRSDEVFLFHAALLDAQSGRFIHTERLARAGWDAKASEEGLSVRVGDAALRSADEGERFVLDAGIRDDAGFSLRLEALKPLVVFGKDGVSRKGDSPTAASWYLTFPRLQAVGEVRLKDRLIPVEGRVWMDHEISSSQLTGEQAGWDWAGIQFEDGREIMVYRLRRKDGATDPASALAWVDELGKTTHYGASEFRWEASAEWRSPRTGARYPVPVRLSAVDPKTGKGVEWILEPLVADQELDGAVSGVPYWEGACRVLQEGKEVGSAYVELTGYAGALGRALK
jgi:predicted secreted hydrolase